jgi:A/G-specific adenine glycosylase
LNFLLLRRKLKHWYDTHRRDLPWRRTRDPYAIWISEIMLQQTRVAAAIPYYEKFLGRFPGVGELAAASETEVLAHWSGLGYYSRARNLYRAAKAIAEAGAFPKEYEAIRALPGIGDYTAAAVGSIAFGLPHAVVDGNVKRVAARLANDALVDVQDVATRLMDRDDPAASNQALMELGALVCLPKTPLCSQCPVAGLCGAKKHGTQAELPAKKARRATERLARTLLVIRRSGKVLVVPGEKVLGFWDLPEPFRGAEAGDVLGVFRHTILHRQYTYKVREGIAKRVPLNSHWWSAGSGHEIPLSTTAKKALRCLQH